MLGHEDPIEPVSIRIPTEGDAFAGALEAPFGELHGVLAQRERETRALEIAARHLGAGDSASLLAGVLLCVLERAEIDADPKSATRGEALRRLVPTQDGLVELVGLLASHPGLPTRIASVLTSLSESEALDRIDLAKTVLLAHLRIDEDFR